MKETVLRMQAETGGTVGLYYFTHLWFNFLTFALPNFYITYIYLNYAVLNVFKKIYIIYTSVIVLLAVFKKLDTSYYTQPVNWN